MRSLIDTGKATHTCPLCLATPLPHVQKGLDPWECRLREGFHHPAQDLPGPGRSINSC